jgi:glycosyltransferase involved in cell wall biosynthesis
MAYAGEKTPPLRDGAAAQSGEGRPAGRRILIIVENLPVPFDRRVWMEARTLRAAGYEVSVICPRGPFAESRYECLEGVHIYRHPLPLEASGKLGYVAEYASALFWEFVYSVRVWRERGFDAIQACNPPDFIFLVGAFYKYLFRKKFVFDHHDLNPELFEAKFGKRGAIWKALRILERLTFKAADLSIATNESYRKVAVRRGGMTPDRVYVVRSGPDLNRVRAAPPDDRWKNGRKRLAAYVGVIGEQEGVDLLIEAMEHVVRVRGREDVQAVVMGSGPQFAAVRALAESKGLAPFMTFTGRVDDATLFTVLSTADICVNPDRPNAMNDQSTMNKTMEYMALGKAMVQFDLTEGRVSAGESSLYARNTDPGDFGDKMLELLDDPERRRIMGEFGRKRVQEELSWPHEAPKLLACYERLFGEDGGWSKAPSPAARWRRR